MRFISADFGEPGLEIVAQHVLVEQFGEREIAARDAQRQIAEAPHGQRIFVGDEAERPHARALEPARQQHAERLVREPPFERIADEIIFGGAREGLDQQSPARGSSERHCWISSHSRTCCRQRAPSLGFGEHLAHARGEIGRERKLAAFIGRHLRVGGVRARDIDLVLDQRLVFAGSRRRTRRCRPASASR